MTADLSYLSSLTGSISERRLAALQDRPLPVIGPIARILLLCARERLDEPQLAQLQSLCADVGDWRRLVQQANFRMIVPLVAKHLAGLPSGLVPADTLDALKRDARAAVLRNLAMIALHSRLVREVLDPLRVRHLFFKGPSLAYRYYREPALRQFRDIDVLVPQDEMVRVGKRMRDLGFRPLENEHFGTDDGLAFLNRFGNAMNWLSPEDVVIEMPASLDGDWGRLPTDQVIERAESVSMAGLDVPVVSTADFFCYMCKHHSRHHWARLHWIADLNAILAHPDFDLNVVTQRASDRDFARTVAAALEIQAAAADSVPWRRQFRDPFARELFRHCLINLEGDFAQELALRDSFPAAEIDVPPARLYRRQFVTRNLNRFRPRAEDFLQLPLPASLHGMYYILRPGLWVMRKLIPSRPKRAGDVEEGAPKP